MNASVAPRWPAKEPQPLKLKPGFAPPWCCENISKNAVSQFFTQKTLAEKQKQLSYYRAAANEWSVLLFPRYICVGPSFSYKSLSGGVVKLVSKDVCPLRCFQRFLPDCIRNCAEKRIIRLRKDAAGWCHWTVAFRWVVVPSRHPRILKNLPDLLRNWKK